MPSVVNGVGTWYHGKKNVISYEGVCRSCGATTQLTSYDTRLFFVFLLIPIIPLEKKRVLEECARCQRHYTMPLSEWERARKHAEEAAQEYRADPGNKDRAMEALAACEAHRDLQAFEAIAGDIERNLGQDPDVVGALGEIHSTYGHADIARRLYTRMVELDNSHENREILGYHLMMMGDLEGARRCFQHILDEKIPDRVELVFCLAQNCQIQGKHVEALELYDYCARINPALAQTDRFQKSKALAEKHQHTGKKVSLGAINRLEKGVSYRRRIQAAVAALLIAVGVYCFVAWWMGAHQEVYLVNGLSVPYCVLLNGEAHDLDPDEVRTVRLSQGDVSIRIDDLDASLFPEASASVHTPFLTRPFSDTVFVINPDRAALIWWSRVPYGKKSQLRSAKAQAHAVAGKPFYRWDDMDYPFEPFPKSLSVSSGSGVKWKQGLSLLARERGATKSRVFQLYGEEVSDKEALTGALRRLAKAEPDGDAYLVQLFSRLDSGEFVAFVESELGTRPIRLEWHRFYQNAMRDSRKFEELEDKYREQMEETPDSADAVYLAARACWDPSESERLLLKATRMDPPCNRAGEALAYLYLGQGRVEEAGPYVEKAIERSSEYPVLSLYFRYLFSQGDYAKIKSVCQKSMKGQLFESITAMHALVQAMGCAGESTKAVRESADLYFRITKDQFPDSWQRDFRHLLYAEAAYASGDIKKSAEWLSRIEQWPSERFAMHLQSGDVAAAHSMLQKIEPDEEDYLIVWVAAKVAGRDDLTEGLLEKACEELDHSGYGEYQCAEAIRGKSALPASRITMLPMDIGRKKRLMVVLGILHPEDRATYFTMARKLNFIPSHPARLLNDAMEHYK